MAPPPTTPKPRADAQRNRDRLLAVATEAFTGTAVESVTLDNIAKRAGVGIGTLYRHFPTREALVEAVYRSELAALCDSAADLVAEMRPEQALRAWTARYGEFVTTKRGMADALREVIASGAISSSDTRQHLNGAIQTILDAGVGAGTLRADVLAEDVSATLAGVLLATPSAKQDDQRGRMLDLLADALVVRR
jgi:AcrR family transcriptional regulator